MSQKLKIDIIIPGYYSAETTLRCIESVVQHSNTERYDLKIILSEDSADQPYSDLIRLYLQQNNLEKEIEFIQRAERGGFIENCYTGIEFRESDYKILLNSDTIVTPGWLEPMIELAESDDKIAIVNPVCNNSPILSVTFPPGSNMLELTKFVKNFRYSKEDFIDITTSVGFCMVIKDKYIKQYGFFDRIFGMGYCEETDLHFRFLSHGLRAVISPNSFVYHRGEGSFSGDRKKLIEMNQAVFYERWGEALKKDLEIYKERTIMHRIRQEVEEFSSSLNLKVLFTTENDDLTLPENKILHRMINYLNESGISANFVCTDQIFTLSENNEDRTYTPLPSYLAHKVLVDPQLLIFTSFNQISKLRRLIKSPSSSNLKYAFLLTDYTGDKDLQLLKENSVLFDYILNYSSIESFKSHDGSEVLEIGISSSMDLANYLFKEKKLTREIKVISIFMKDKTTQDSIASSIKELEGWEIKTHEDFSDEIFKSDILITDHSLSIQDISDLNMGGVHIVKSDEFSMSKLNKEHTAEIFSPDNILEHSDRYNLPPFIENIIAVMSRKSSDETKKQIKNYISDNTTLLEKLKDLIKSISSR